MIKLFNHYFDRRTLLQLFMDLLLVSAEATQRLMPDAPLFTSETPGAERMTLNQIASWAFVVLLMCFTGARRLKRKTP